MSIGVAQWLKNKCNLDVTGRQEKKTEGVATTPEASEPKSGVSAMFDKWGGALFGNGRSKGENESNGQVGTNPTGVVYDEQGLPIDNQPMYILRTDGQGYMPHPDAPAHIREEYERRLKEDEMKATGAKKDIAPPPPPSLFTATSGAHNQPSQHNKKYAETGYFAGETQPTQQPQNTQWGSVQPLPTPMQQHETSQVPSPNTMSPAQLAPPPPSPAFVNPVSPSAMSPPTASSPGMTAALPASLGISPAVSPAQKLHQQSQSSLAAPSGFPAPFPSATGSFGPPPQQNSIRGGFPAPVPATQPFPAPPFGFPPPPPKH